MLRRILELLLKEFRELRRDTGARYRLLIPPLLQMLLFGYAATFEIFHIPTALLDLDHSQPSRALASALGSTGRFQLQPLAGGVHDAGVAIATGRAQLALVIPPGYAARLRAGQTATVQVLVDGTDSNAALIALGYVGQIAAGIGQASALELRQRHGLGGRPLPGVDMAERYWYNPNLNSRWFFVPGVVASLTLITIVNLTAFAIVREREVGTLEQLLVTPIRPLEFIIGKSLPFFLIGLVQAGLTTLLGIAWFGVPFKGDPGVLLAGTALFLMTALAIGLLISTVCRTQQQAFASNFFVLNPMFILSGFSFPIASMPLPLQWLTWLDPLRYYLVIVRGAYTKGVGWTVLWPQMLALLAIGAALTAVAILRFRKSLD